MNIEKLLRITFDTFSIQLLVPYNLKSDRIVSAIRIVRQLDNEILGKSNEIR